MSGVTEWAFDMRNLSMEDVGCREEGWLWGWSGGEGVKREAVKVDVGKLLLLLKLVCGLLMDKMVL